MPTMRYTITNLVYKPLALLMLSLISNGCAENPVEPLIGAKPNVVITPKPVYEYPVHPLTGTYAESQAVKDFIKHMATTHGFDEGYLNDIFSQAHHLDYVVRLENAPQYSGPKGAKPRLGSWTQYRKQFLSDAHIRNGVEFWSLNSDAIKKASETYNVDPEYIVAIIGVETFFGRNVGKTCTFDALTTLAFDTQRRSEFFKQELEHFLLMSREEHYNPKEPVGSWAGAMGLGQFMPSSFRRLAVDFNQDGQRNLWHREDAIGSVAHYFSRNGWQFKQPVTEAVSEDSGSSVITLGAHAGYEYWQIYPNFEVIKKYNNSNKYAMAVHQLAQAIKKNYTRL